MRNVDIGARRGSDIALTEFPLEEFERHSINDSSRRRIVTGAFITHKGVCTVEFVPAKIRIRIGQCIVNNGSSFARHMWILPAKNNQQLALDIRNAVERVIVESFAETSFVNVGRITAACSKHFRIHCCPKRKMTPDAKTHCPKL